MPREAHSKKSVPPERGPTLILQASTKQHAPEDELAKEMTHDLEMNFNKIAPFGKEDTAKELQDHAAKTQDTLVDAVENAEVAEIKRAVFRALTRLRAATIKEFDTIARLETQAIDAYNGLDTGQLYETSRRSMTTLEAPKTVKQCALDKSRKSA